MPSMLGKIFSKQHFDVFCLFFLEKSIRHFMPIGDKLHEMSNSIFFEKKKSIINLLSAEFAHRVLSVNTRTGYVIPKRNTK